MVQLVITRSATFQQFLQNHLQMPLEFKANLYPPAADSRQVHLLHLSSLDSDDCRAWLQQHVAGKSLPIAACSNLPLIEEMLDCVNLGIRAYCNSHMAALHYQQMFDMLAHGQSWFPPEMLGETFRLAQQASQAKPALSNVEALTARENEIALFVAEGMSNRKIAERLGISEPTVKSHMNRIFKKLDLNDRVGLVLHLKRA